MKDYQNVKSCWAKIRAEKGSNQLVENFYQILFSRHPELRNLFPSDIERQKRKLLSSLDNVINGIEYIDAIKNELMDLGRHHKNIGITKEMFDTFIITILDAADYASNSSLTHDERTAWKNSFREISDIMLEAY